MIRSEDVERRGARLYFQLNLLIVLTAIVAVLISRLIVRSDWLVVIAALLVPMAGFLHRAGRWVDQNRVVAAVRIAASLNWIAAVLAALIVPAALTIVCLIAAIPVLLALPHLSRERLEPLFGMAVVVSVAVAVTGRWSPGVGLDEAIPRWLFVLLLITFVLMTVGMISVLAWCNHAALLARTRALRDSRERLVVAADRERHRVERALGERAHRQLAAVTAEVTAARGRIDGPREPAAGALAAAADTLVTIGSDLRELAHGIYPPELAAYGLVAALRAAVRRAAVPATVEADGIDRYGPDVELGVYTCCLEGLLNAARHGGADARVEISLRREADGSLSFRIDDTGVGCDPALPRRGAGITSLIDHLGALGGSLTVSAAPGAGVHLYGRIDAPAPVGVVRRRGGNRLLAKVWAGARSLWSWTSPEPSPDPTIAGLRALCAFALVGALGDLLVYVVVPHQGVLVIAAGSATLALVHAWAASTRLGALRPGRSIRRVLVANIAGAVFMIGCTTLVPVTMDYHTIVALVPVLLASPVLARGPFRCLVGANVAVTGVLVGTGLFSPGVGIQDRVPRVAVNVYVTVMLVVCTTLLLFLAWLNHTTMSARAAALQRSRQRMVTAAQRERRRIERDLHDGAQQRLAAAGMRLRAAERMVLNPDRPVHDLTALLDEIIIELAQADVEIVELARGIYPTDLVEHGLATALTSVASRSPVPVAVNVDRLGRYRQEVEVGVYFSCLEALSNAIKHGGPGARVEIRLHEEPGGKLCFEVGDTGVGWDPTHIPPGHGLTNMADRIGAVGGTLRVVARPGAGTRLRGQIRPTR
jgi:signal transduction histidine kinase